MNKRFKAQTLIIGFMITALSVTAQEEETAPITSVIPKYVSDKGYWVVEGNIHNKQQHTIHFYNNADLQVYQQRITGSLKLKKRKILMHMKRMLDTAVVAWEQRKPLNENLFAATK
jgi:hypothetical protein